jgi:hypothetical protein
MTEFDVTSAFTIWGVWNQRTESYHLRLVDCAGRTATATITAGDCSGGSFAIVWGSGLVGH